ncbi:hypothetical protein XENOCAPTIV_028370, partial [Xenoophorus captivus]
LSMQEVLSGAVELAVKGFPIAEVTAYHWAKWVAALRDSGKEQGEDLLIGGHPPKHGQVFKNIAMARTIKRGKPAFYQGRVAQAIVDVINQNGGVMTMEDLSSHDSEVVSPISTEYKVTNQKRLNLCFYTTVSRVTDVILCLGCAPVGASSQQPGPGRLAAPQHPGELSSAQRYMTGTPRRYP